MISKRDVELNQYMPPVIGQAREIKALLTAENPEFNLLWEEMVRFEKDIFVLTAEEYGIQRWVKLMDLDVSGLSLEEQRALVILKLNENIPYTDRSFRQMLDLILTKYTFRLDYQEYVFYLGMPLIKSILLKKVMELAERVIPANLIHQFGIEERLPTYFATALTSGEEVTVFPYQITEIESRGTISVATGYNVSYETIEIKPKP